MYNVVLISTAQHSDSFIHTYLLLYMCIHIIFHIHFHYGVSQNIEYGSLCYTVGLCCLSVLYIIVCIC